MMSWFQIAILALKFGTGVLEWIKRKQAFDAGQDEEALKAARAVLDLTDRGKKIGERIDALSDGDLDDVLADMVKPPEPGQGVHPVLPG